MSMMYIIFIGSLNQYTPLFFCPQVAEQAKAHPFIPEELQFLAVAHPKGEVYNRESDKK